MRLVNVKVDSETYWELWPRVEDQVNARVRTDKLWGEVADPVSDEIFDIRWLVKMAIRGEL